MKYIRDPRGHKIEWTRPKLLIRYHELRSDGGLYATLKWKNTFGSLAVGECREGRFTFRQAGFLRPFVTVRREGFESNLATMRFSSGSVIMNAAFGIGGILEFETGQKFAFNRLSFWKSRWAFTDESGIPVVTFNRKMRGRPTANIIIDEDFGDTDFIHILLIIGWYVIMLDYEEAEATSGLA